MDSDEKLPSLPPRSSLWDRIRLRGSTITVTLATALLFAFTIFFSYNSSLEQPYLAIFVSQNPSRSILILNIASNLTLFFLANLTTTILESIRWTLACHGTGTPALTFLTLSTATGVLGSVFLSFGKNRVPGSFPVNDHRVWGIQRYFHLYSEVLIPGLVWRSFTLHWGGFCSQMFLSSQLTIRSIRSLYGRLASHQ